jgi:hypothetical protein
VASGFIVHVRADGDTKEARNVNYDRANAGMTAGAQVKF